MVRQPLMRPFATIVPIEKISSEAPAEIQSTPLSDAMYKDMQEQYETFNESCKAEL